MNPALSRGRIRLILFSEMCISLFQGNCKRSNGPLSAGLSPPPTIYERHIKQLISVLCTLQGEAGAAGPSGPAGPRGSPVSRNQSFLGTQSSRFTEIHETANLTTLPSS